MNDTNLATHVVVLLVVSCFSTNTDCRLFCACSTWSVRPTHQPGKDTHAILHAITHHNLSRVVLLQVLRRLEGLVESEGSPSQDPSVIFLTRLLQLAVASRTMLRERQYCFPAASDQLLKTFYPILSTFILEVQLREPDETDGDSFSLPFCPLEDCQNLMLSRSRSDTLEKESKRTPNVVPSAALFSKLPHPFWTRDRTYWPAGVSGNVRFPPLVEEWSADRSVRQCVWRDMLASESILEA